MGLQPFRDRRGLVGSIVVADQVDLEMVGDLVVDLGQELLELDGAMARWRRCMLEITDPSSVLNAANRLVVPCLR